MLNDFPGSALRRFSVYLPKGGSDAGTTVGEPEVGNNVTVTDIGVDPGFCTVRYGWKVTPL
jgi:hypothetical protein